MANGVGGAVVSAGAELGTEEVAKGLFAGVGGAALKSGLLAGGIGLAVPIALKGLMALTPAAIAKRRADRKELRDAEEDVAKGRAGGFGPSRAERERDVRKEMRAFARDMGGAEENLKAQEAALGFGRSGALAGARERIARAYADTRGKVRGAVEDRAEKIGERREALALNRLAAARGQEARRIAANQQFAMQVGTSAITSGLQAGMAKKQQIEGDTRRTEQNVAMLAATGGPEAVDAYRGFLSDAATERAAAIDAQQKEREKKKAARRGETEASA